jgi:hypothetical protein
MPTEEKIIGNLERCSHFDGCSQNLCPLDLDLYSRTGGGEAKCRWMREPKKKKIGDKEFISGGRVMPDALLNFVPESNLKSLNESSQKRWKKLKNK